MKGRYRYQWKNIRMRLAAIVMLAASGLALTAESAAQNTTTPYSMYGYGIIGDRATSSQRQMGGVGIAMSSGRQINAMNPASYAAIDSLTFLFDMGADIAMLWSKEGSAKDNSVGGGLDYITMQFPLCKFMGASIGLLPYSSVGYAFGNSIAHGTVENQGNGGINMAYLGVAGTYAGASLGVNVSYNFGNIINDVYASPSNSGRSLTEHVMQIRDWDIQIGAQYRLKFDRSNSMTIGATFTPKKPMHGTTWVTTQEMTIETKPDTVAYAKMGGLYEAPNSFGVGLSYKHERAGRFMVEADFICQYWSKAKYSPLYRIDHPEQLVFRGMDFANRMRYSAGAEWVPKLRGSYMQRVEYRIGGYYVDDYLKINGNRVREYGITCGLGLHTPSDKTVINIGFEWKQRRAHPQPLISENYFNIMLGVNFNELWFWQRKIR